MTAAWNPAAAEQRARDLLTSTDLFEDIGLGRLAAAARTVARDSLEALDQLAAERSARESIAAQRDRALAVLERRAAA